jgi:diguanylate cyclase (GGDEF)-like protein
MNSVAAVRQEAQSLPRVRLLLVEDAPADVRLVKLALSESPKDGFDVTAVSTAAEMAVELARKQFDAIVLDLSLPDATGLDALEAARKLTPTLPIVVLTGLDDEEAALRATRYGAQEYLVKGRGAPTALARVVRNAMERQRMLLALEEARNREHHLATHDPLTSLANRPVIRDLVESEIARALRNDRKFAVVFVDLDGFKQVNDFYGHEVGDHLLREVGRRLKSCLRSSDSAARLGGDEFLVLLTDLGHAEDAAPVARRLVAELARPVDVLGRTLPIGASVGISLFPEDGRTCDALMQSADAAMYSAKSHGGRQFRFHTPGQHSAIQQRAELQQSLRAALRDHSLTLHYQPHRDVRNWKIVAVEALLRWPRGGELLPPSAFLDDAERAGLLPSIGEWVIDEAAKQVAQWRSELQPQLRLALNVSGKELRALGFPSTLRQRLLHRGLPAEAVDLEVPHAAFEATVNDRFETLDELAHLGVAIWLDDFGVTPGASELLNRGLVHGLKIDSAFVAGLPDDKASRAAVTAIAEFAARHRLPIAAEAVENEEQERALTQHGCWLMQGYRFAPPVPASEIPLHLRNA